LTEILSGEHNFDVNGEPWLVFVDRVVVVPQPFGSFFDMLMDGEGRLVRPDLSRGKVGIVDVGTYTTDVALSDSLEYVAKASGSKTSAMSTVWREIRDDIRRLYGIEYELHEIDGLLLGGKPLIVQGKVVNINSLVQRAVDGLSKRVVSVCRETWGKALDFNLIILTGGGAPYVREAMGKVYPHSQVVFAPHVGNLRGFYKYMLRKSKIK